MRSSPGLNPLHDGVDHRVKAATDTIVQWSRIHLHERIPISSGQRTWGRQSEESGDARS